MKGTGRAASANRPNASCNSVDWDSGSMLTTFISLILDVSTIMMTHLVSVSLVLWRQKLEMQYNKLMSCSKFLVLNVPYSTLICHCHPLSISCLYFCVLIYVVNRAFTKLIVLDSYTFSYRKLRWNLFSIEVETWGVPIDTDGQVGCSYRVLLYQYAREMCTSIEEWLGKQRV